MTVGLFRDTIILKGCTFQMVVECVFSGKPVNQPEVLMSKEGRVSNKVVITAQRKSHFGNKRGGRSGKTGKRAIIYNRTSNGEEVEVSRISAPTFKALSRKLRSDGLIPANVVLNHNGVTEF